MRKSTLGALVLGLPLAAYGYTDPGTGIFLYQAIVATMVGAGWTARRFLGRLVDRVQQHLAVGRRVAED